MRQNKKLIRVPVSVKLGYGFIICVSLAGCALFVFEQREKWRDEAEAACVAAGRFPASAYAVPERAVSGPGACGMEQPFRISAFLNGSVTLKSKGLLACPAASTFDRWLADVVEPAAMLYFGQAVTTLHTGTYNCRKMNNRSTGSRSEHSYGNAVDVMWLGLADGRIVSVKSGWKGASDEAAFLREIFIGACRYFPTVLAPGSDRYHSDHFHLDLARHGTRGGRAIRVCQPTIKFMPRLDGRAVAQGAPSMIPMQPVPVAQTPLPQTPIAQPSIMESSAMDQSLAEPPLALSETPQSLTDLY